MKTDYSSYWQAANPSRFDVDKFAGIFLLLKSKECERLDKLRAEGERVAVIECLWQK